MKIRWLPEAAGDLDRIDRFWRDIDPELARRAAESILVLTESLDQLPERGRVSRVDPESRELVTPFGAGAFILRYRIIEGDIIVVQVRHSRERHS
ncbi:type II toxin-antitoxin system RelE/ParE family toxin [Hyphomonas sp. NPDC076900]|uniref:type II toxin-antitoxin system RelE/ParE family toxin n=1 Tax=unclassified Hyphomonas TaxID=2630699 RepID=UPI003D06229D